MNTEAWGSERKRKGRRIIKKESEGKAKKKKERFMEIEQTWWEKHLQKQSRPAKERRKRDKPCFDGCLLRPLRDTKDKLKRHGGTLSQIGRASCRERV